MNNLKKTTFLLIMLLSFTKVSALTDFFEQSYDFISTKYLTYTNYYIYEVDDVEKIKVLYDSLLLVYSIDNPYRSNKFPKIVIRNMNEVDVDTVINRLEHIRSNIISIYFDSCTFESVPKNLNMLENLESITFNSCNQLKTFGEYNSPKTTFVMFFINCNLDRLPEKIELFKPLLKLWISFPDNFTKMNLNYELNRFLKRNNLLSLYIRYKNLSSFPSSILELSSLQYLVFQSNNYIIYPKSYDKLVNIRRIIITDTTNLTRDELKSNSLIEAFITFPYQNDSLSYIKYDRPFYSTDYYSEDSSIIYVYYKMIKHGVSRSVDNHIYNYKKAIGNEWNTAPQPIFRKSEYYIQYFNSKGFAHNLEEMKLQVKYDEHTNSLILNFDRKPEQDVIIEVKDRTTVFTFERIKTREQEIIIELDKLFIIKEYFSPIFIKYKNATQGLNVL